MKTIFFFIILIFCFVLLTFISKTINTFFHFCFVLFAFSISIIDLLIFAQFLIFQEIKNQQDQKQPSKHQNRDRSSGSSATNPLHYKPPAPHQQQQSQSQSPAELAFISSLLADPSFNPATLPPHLQHVFHTFLLQSSKQPTDNPFFNKASFPLLPQQQQSLKHSLFPGQLPSPIEKSRYSPFSIEHNKSNKRTSIRIIVFKNKALNLSPYTKSFLKVEKNTN